jgi:hypothetical protein
MMKRASYAAALLLSGLCVAVSAVGLAGALDREPTPSATVIAAASQLAASEHASGYCPWSDGDRREGVELSSTSSSWSGQDA